MNLPDDYTIRLIDLPASVGGFMSECPDGHVDVYINARWGHGAQLDSTDHEFEHWRNNDLHNGKDIRTIERKVKRLKLCKASELPPPKKKPTRPAQRKTLTSYDDWKNDIYLTLPFFDEYFPTTIYDEPQ